MGKERESKGDDEGQWRVREYGRQSRQAEGKRRRGRDRSRRGGKGRKMDEGAEVVNERRGKDEGQEREGKEEEGIKADGKEKERTEWMIEGKREP